MTDRHNRDSRQWAREIIDLTPNFPTRKEIVALCRKIRDAHPPKENPIDCDPPERIPAFPHVSQWLYSLFDPDEAGYKSLDGGKTARTTLHLGSYPRDVAERMVRRCKELGHTHITVCTRSGLDARKSFGLTGTYDWLKSPAQAWWLFDLCASLELPLFMFGLEDDDLDFNRDWDRVRSGWGRFLDTYGNHPYLSAWILGIEMDEPTGEQNIRPQSAKVKTIAMAIERYVWVKSYVPGLPIGDHYSGDTALWCADFSYYQIDPRNHDGTRRSKGALRDEFGPGRRGGEAISHNQPLIFAESADEPFTPRWLADNQVAGAHQGLQDSGLIVPATGMGK